MEMTATIALEADEGECPTSHRAATEIGEAGLTAESQKEGGTCQVRNRDIAGRGQAEWKGREWERTE
eukprot:5394141-Pleurochrysis_carterae.AAC.2